MTEYKTCTFDIDNFQYAFRLINILDSVFIECYVHFNNKNECKFIIDLTKLNDTQKNNLNNVLMNADCYNILYK